MTIIILSMGLLVVAGLLFLRFADYSELSLDVRIGTAFLLGSALLTVAMLALSGVGLKWSPLTVMATSLVLTSSGLLIRKSGAEHQEMKVGGGYPLADALLILVLTVHALYVTESAPRHWDYWAIWGLKAKVFAAGGTIDWSFLTDPANAFAHPDYPLLLTMIYSFLASWGETWNDRWFGLVDTAFVTSLLLVVRGVCTRLFGSVAIGSWTALLLAFPAMQIIFGYADLPLFAFVTCGLLFLQMHLQRPTSRLALLGFLLLGGGALTKNEGLSFLLIALVVAAMASRRPKWTTLMAVPGLVLVASWQIPRLFLDLSTDVTRSGWLPRAAERIDDPTLGLALWHFLPSTAVAALITVSVAALLARERLKRLALLVAVPALQLLIYLGVYMGSPHDLTWHIATSWSRISLHVAIPILAVSIPVLVEVLRHHSGTIVPRDSDPVATRD